jgi:hypothetical protein
LERRLCVASEQQVSLVGHQRIHRPGTPALFISGYAQPAAEEPEIEQLLQPFLPKPFTPDQLRVDLDVASLDLD